MKRYLLLFFALCCFCNSDAIAGEEVIDEIYTESLGNNPYEAKIKALDKAMYRSVIIMADKLGVKDSETEESFQEIPIDELKSVFNNINIKTEEAYAYLSGARYSARIEFKFNQSQMNALIKKYSSNKVQEQLLTALVIPMFKINKIKQIEADKRGWIQTWQRSRPKLAENRLIFQEPENYKNYGITSKNILSLSFEQILQKLPNKLYGRIIIPIGEFFTNRSTGDSFFRVKYVSISKEEKKELSKDYDIPAKGKNSFDFVKALIVDDFIKDYGHPITHIDVSNKTQYMADVQSGLIKDVANLLDEKFYMFLVQIDYDGEMEKIQKKLNGIDEIHRFEISMHFETGYKIKIYTDLDVMTLSDKLYQSGLSYFYNQYKNPVIINVER
ncbi:MAG: hypothetical protein SFT91_00810 [Rickettsiaceae bacterium]|nr:hypothetical protein [Rickettsiaceae bacterium]